MALAELAKFYDSLTAGAAQGRLGADGIDAYLFDIGMTLQGAGFAIPVRLMVDEDDLPRARRILAEPGPGASQPRAPKSAVPTRTWVAPTATAVA